VILNDLTLIGDTSAQPVETANAGGRSSAPACFADPAVLAGYMGKSNAFDDCGIVCNDLARRFARKRTMISSRSRSAMPPPSNDKDTDQLSHYIDNAITLLASCEWPTRAEAKTK